MWNTQASAADASQIVVVASRNPVKLKAVERGFARMFPDRTFSVLGMTVPSGVPDQPMSDLETLQGALNRVQNARKASGEADYWVGLEGGVNTDLEGCLQSFAWIAVQSTTLPDRTGKSRTATFYQPEEVASLVKSGLELGKADDQVFGRENSKQANGSSGLLTGDAISRTEGYEQAVILALIPFKNPDLTFKT